MSNDTIKDISDAVKDGISTAEEVGEALLAGLEVAQGLGAGGAVLDVIEAALRAALDLLGHNTARVENVVVRGRISVSIKP